MIKKLLILPILGLVGLTSLSYANTIDGYTSDSNIIVKSFTASDLYYGSTGFPDFMTLLYDGEDDSIYNQIDGEHYYFCISSSNIPYLLANYQSLNYDYNYAYVNTNNYCFPYANGREDANIYPKVPCDSYETDPGECYDNKDISGKFYVSTSPITYSSSSDSSDSSTVFPTIPSSFTSGITALVSNFGSIIVGWLPSIILVALGIFAIFALFRVVRNYARSSFHG